MTIDEVIKASKPYSGRKRENMTVLQRLRIDLVAEAQDYDHRMMHAYRNERKEHQRIADDLVEIAQNYAWRYAKHRQKDMLEKLLKSGHGGGNWRRLIISEIARIDSDLKEYQEQFKNMQLM